MRKRRILCAAVLCIFLGLSSFQPGQTQDSEEAIPPEDQELARQHLFSPLAPFLSGSGVNALNILSGVTHSHILAQRLERGNAELALPFQSSRFQVLVNDPAQDPSSFFDISTQSETSVAASGNHVVVTFNDSGQWLVPPAFTSIMGYSVSTDGGASFTDLGRVPTGALFRVNLGDPAVVANRTGDFYVAALAFDGSRPAGFRNTLSVQKSTDGALTWGGPVYLPLPPAAGVLAGSFQDKEFIAVDNSGSACDGNVYLSWTSFQPFPLPPGAVPQLPIFFSRSTNGGASFLTPMQISPLGHVNQGSEPAVGPNGEVYVTWFRFSGPVPAPGQPPLPPAIMVAKSNNCGASFGPAVVVAAPVTAIGFRGGSFRGNFRLNSFPRIDVNPVNGHVYIVYAANPPGSDGGDVFFTRSTDGGATWSIPVRVNDDPATNDQFFPDVAVNQQGVTEIIWYDRRHDQENYRIDVFKTRSFNSALSFGPNQRVTQFSWLPAVGYDPIIARTYMGDYLDIKAETTPSGVGARFLLSWGDFRRIVTTIGGVRPDQDVFFAPD